MNAKNKKALLTGASGGIGEEMAKILAQKGYDLILVARNAEKLKNIAENIKRINNKIKCEYFTCDLSKDAEVTKLITAYPEADILINNAGFGNYGVFHNQPWERECEMIMVNVAALARLCHHYIHGMVLRGYGRVLNVASTAGLFPIPFCATYAATKAFVVQFSKSLSAELKGTGVTVSCLLPGPTATEFWYSSNMSSKVKKAIKNYRSPREVAEFGINLMEKGKIAGVPGWSDRLKQVIKRYMPEKILLYIMRKHMIHPSLK